jgi:hypothetical protein
MLDLSNNNLFEETQDSVNQSIPSTEELMRKASQLGQPGQAPVPSSKPVSSYGPITMDQAYELTQDMNRKTRPFYGTGFTEPITTPERIGRKYAGQEFGFMPGIDNEDIYAQRQGSLAKIGSAIPKFVLSAVAKTGQGVGFIGGLLNPANMLSEDGYIASASDNAFSKAFTNMEDWVKNDFFLTTTFQEAKDRDKGFFARAFTDLDFWTEDVVDAAAFLASAYVPGTLLSKLGLGMKIARGLSATRLGVTAASGTIEGLQAVPNYLRNASSLAKSFDKVTTWALATGAEAMVEAKGVKDYLTEQLENDYTLTPEEKKKIIAGATQNTFLMNAALLGFTNFFEMKSFYKLLGKTEGTVSNIVSPALGKDFVSTISPAVSKFDRFLQSPARDFLTGVAAGTVREGFVEENAQLAIQRLNQQYGLAGKVATINDIGNLGKQYLSQTYGAVFGPNTPENRETSLNIGLGGIIGGISTGIGDMVQGRRDVNASASAMQALNQSQTNWMKFGNIYKTETFDQTGSDGKTFKSERLVLDTNGKPKEDLDKINAIAGSFTTNIDLLKKADEETVPYKASIMRDMAFTEFVQAHVNAGLETTLLDKLDDAINAKPEDLLALGFNPSEDYKKQISDYKSLASKIIDQNKLINQDILFDNSVEDQNRKLVMLDLAAKQAIYDKNAENIKSQKVDIQNKLINSNNSSLTDSLVDQLNSIQFKIDSLQQVIDESSKSSLSSPLNDKVNSKIIDDLTKEKEKLLKDNQLSVEKLSKPDNNGYYKYENKARNEDPLMKLYSDKMRLQSQIENASTQNGLKFALLADAKKGKQNFKDLFNEEIYNPVQDALKRADEARSKDDNLDPAKPSPEALSVKIKVKTLDGKEVEVEITEGLLYQGKENDEIIKFKVLSINEKDDLVTIEQGKENPVTIRLSELAKLIQSVGFEPIIPKNKGTAAKGTSVDSTKSDDNELDQEIEDETEFDFKSNSQPRFEDIGFNKTFGKHYLDSDDTILNDVPGSARFFEFTGKHNLAKRGYALEVVTADNDKFKIRQDKYPNDIKVIVVKKITDTNGNITYRYVDVNNQIIPEGQETADNIIYRSLANKNNWNVEQIRNSYAVGKNTTDEQIQKEIDNYKLWQENLENRVKEGPVYLTITRTSPGVQAIVRTNAIGENGLNEIAKFDMEGRVIAENPDYNDLRSAVNPDVNIRLRVATADGALGPGIKAGRVIMQEYNIVNGTTIYGDKLFRVFNRAFTDSEKDNLTRIFARLSELYNKKYYYDNKKKRKVTKKISEEEENEIEIIQNYLKGVVNLRTAKTKDKITYKTYWIDNGLHRGSTKIDFNSSEIIKSKEQLFGKDPNGNDAFHHINASLLTKNDSFTEVNIKGGKAIQTKQWDSYQEYLIAKREDNSVPPVYTSLPPVNEPGRPQRTSVYIEWRDPTVKDETEEKEDGETSADTLKFERNYKSATDQNIDKFLNLQSKQLKVRNISFWIAESSDGYQIKYKRKNSNQTSSSQIFRSADEFKKNRSVILKNIQEIAGYRYGGTQKISEFLSKKLEEEKAADARDSQTLPDDLETYLQQEYELARKASESQGIKIFSFVTWKATVGRTIADRYNRLKANQKTKDALQSTQSSTNAVNNSQSNPVDIKYTDVESAVKNVFVLGNELSAKVYDEQGNVKAEAKVILTPDTNLFVAKDKLKKLLLDQLNADDNNAPFRLVTSEEVKEKEDFKLLQSFLDKVLPQFSVYRMAHLISGRAWGRFKNSALYIYQNAEIGTGFHEAFEGVWASYLTDDERSKLAGEFKSRTGKFTNPFSNVTKEYSEASMYDVREMLAEEFREYMLTQKEPSESTIKSFFQHLIDLIKKLFGLSSNDKKELEGYVNKIFKDITKGVYKNAKPIREQSFYDTPLYRSAITDTTVEETSEILDGLNYYFFTGLLSKGSNISSILLNLDKKDSNLLLKENLNNAFASIERDLSNASQRLVNAVKNNKEELYDIFKKNLQRYGVNFDTLDIEETEISDTLGIKESISVDPRKSTDVNVMVLIASLPQTSNNKLVRSVNTNLPKLVDADKVHTILLNELSNIVSIINEDGVRQDTIKLMFNKLDNKFLDSNGNYREGFGWIKNLKRRLRYEDLSGRRIPQSSLERDDISLQVSFTKSFNNSRFTPTKLIIAENGNIYDFNPLMNINSQRIKRNWSNNLQVNLQNKKSKLFKANKDGDLFINRISDEFFELQGFYELSKSSKYSLLDAMSVLSYFGVKFSASLEELEKHKAQIREDSIQILNSAVYRDDIKTAADIYGNDVIGGRINKLIDIEMLYNTEDNILSYLNADGEPQYSVGTPSLYSNMINIINTVKSQKELILTCPWLGYINFENEVVLHPYQTNSELIKKGGIIFDKNGSKRPGLDLTYHVITGTGISDVDGRNTAKLLFPERIAIKIHYLLNNIPLSVINSDKSTEYGIGIPGKLLVKISDVNNLLQDKDNKIITYYLNHLSDELQAAQQQKENAFNIQYYQDGVFNLGHFQDIISDDIKNKFKSEVLEGKKNYDEFLNENQEILKKQIVEHIIKMSNQTYDMLLQEDIFVKPDSFSSNNFITNAVDNNLLDETLGLSEGQELEYTEDGKKLNIRDSSYTPDQVRMLSTLIAINEELLTTEQHKLLYGHPSMYKDLAKRANGATSTKEAIVEDSGFIKWMDEQMPRIDKKERSKDIHQTLKIMSFKDMDVVSLFHKEMAEKMYAEMIKDNVDSDKASLSIGATFDSNGKLIDYRKYRGEYTGAIKVFLSLNEADAMAMIMPDAFRDLLMMSSKFTPQMEAQFNYEIAYEKLVRSGNIPGFDGNYITKKDPSYKNYEEEEVKDAKQIYDKGNPGFSFPGMLKPQYFGYGNGYMANNTFTSYQLMVPKFLKHAVQPKFFRQVEGTQFEKLYLASQDRQVDIIGFESGQKVGNVTTANGSFVSLYNNKGQVNLELSKGKYILPSELPIQNLFSRFYGIQVEQSSKPKKHVVRGTQVTKIIMTNFYENGVPINNEVEKLIEEYNDTLVKIFKLGKKELLEELGLELDSSSGQYNVKDLRNLVNLLRAEAENRDLPDNIIQAINYNIDSKDLEYQFDMLINRDKIDNILNSIVDSRVISSKVNGKSNPQAASTLFESKNRRFVYLNNGIYEETNDLSKLTEEQQSTARIASSDLKFYRSENGKIKSMDVYVGWPYLDLSPEELGLKLVNGIYRIPENGLSNLDERLLNLVAFRIPTQAPNSIESIVIKGFLPPSAGDVIVVPSEIVGKSGSDFDIDKLNLYLPKHEIIGPDYSSEEFRNFMISDLIKRGVSEEVAIKAVAQYTTDEFKKINRATFTENGRLYKNAPFSLESLAPNMVASVRTLTVVKESIQNYNKQFKGKKVLKYIEADDNSKEGLQNKMIEVMNKLILRPENYSQLVSPNTTITLKTLATKIRSLKIAAGSKNEDNEKSATYLRSFTGSVSTRERYLTSKRLVGISALHTTFHVMAQIAGLKINGTYNIDSIKYLFEKQFKKKKSKKESYDPLIKKEEIDIKLNHHSRLDDGTYAIGYKTDVSGQKISDINSESTSGFVDGAKDPFVFDLNLSLKSAGTWFYLMHMGVPVEEIGFFFSQPIMDSYFSEQAKRDSNFKKINDDTFTREDIFFRVIAPFYDKLTGEDLLSSLNAFENNPLMQLKVKNGVLKQINSLYNSYDKFDLEDLKQSVADGKNASPRLQIAVLMAYLRYETQGRYMSNFMQAIGYDTNKTKTIQENVLQVSRWEKSRAEDFIANPDDILNNTFLGELKKQKEDIFNLFRNFFITLDPTVQEVFQPLYSKLNDPDLFITKQDAISLVNRFQNHVLSYILHTTKIKNPEGIDESLNELYNLMFFGENSMASRLYQLKKESSTSDPRITDNLIIQELLPIIPSNEKDIGNVKLFRQRLDTFEVNKVIEALNNLNSYADETGDLVLKEFIIDLAKFSILQSGMNTSYMDYKKVLSTEVYSEMLKEIFNKFNTSKDLDMDQVWKSFHQNNSYNRAIVPKAPSWIRIKDAKLLISPLSSASNQDFYSKSVINPTLTREDVKRLKKAGRGYEAYVSVLFQRTDDTEGGKIVYLPINKMGAGNKLTEIYIDPDSESIIESNNFSSVFNPKDLKKRSGFTSITDLFPEIFGKQEEDEEEDSELNKTGFRGYKYGYVDKGKGTPQGDGKDIAMREYVATGGVIVELSSLKPTSSLTSFKTIEPFTTPKVGTNAFVGGTTKRIMLARNSELSGKPLKSETKEAISKAHKDGYEFVVGDMPSVDSYFIDYLLELDATFIIFHTGSKGSERIRIIPSLKKSLEFKDSKPMNSLRKLIEESKETGEDISNVLERKKNESKNCNN